MKVPINQGRDQESVRGMQPMGLSNVRLRIYELWARLIDAGIVLSLWQSSNHRTTIKATHSLSKIALHNFEPLICWEGQ
jgi:hypothetical protein